MDVKLIIIRSVLLLGIASSYAQEFTKTVKSPALSGCYENRLQIDNKESDIVYLDYNKIKFGAESTISPALKFRCNIAYVNYIGSTTYNLLDYIPEEQSAAYAQNIGSSVDSIRPGFTAKQKDQLYFDNAYASYDAKIVQFRVGKQPLAWGSGYAWNPTDVFNTKNIMDPTYEKTGVTALQTTLPFLKEGLITAVISFSDSLTVASKAIKAKYFFGGFDMSICYAHTGQTEVDYDTFSQKKQYRNMAGAECSGSIVGVGVWAEGAANTVDQKEIYEEIVVGADYTFQNGLYIMGEYYRNGLGKSSANGYRFDDWMNMYGPQAISLGKDYSYIGESMPVGELVTWSNYLFVNCSDQSGMVNPWVDISLGDNADLSFAGYIPFGQTNTEFGTMGLAGFVQAKFYF